MQTTRGTSLNDPAGAGAGSNADHRMLANRRIRLFVGVAACALAVDVVSKVVAVNTLADRDPITLLGGVLTLRLTRNPGAAFSFGTGYTVLLSVIAIGVALAVVRLSSRLGSTGWAIGLGLLLGGACGNLSDRLFREPGPLRGEVVDFLELPNWPVFNAADTTIVLGACLIMLQSVRGIHLDGSRT